MAEDEFTLTPGDWIVHAYCGVGQVRDTERKSIGGAENDYYRIEMLDSTVWYPVDSPDAKNIREISDRNEFRKAIEALKDEPEELSSNINTRKGQISQVLSENSPVSTACLIRDLRARQEAVGSLNQTESQAFRALCDRLIQEWAVCMGITIEDANNQLHQMVYLDQALSGGSVGPTEKRRVQEQDRLLDELNRRGNRGKDD